MRTLHQYDVTSLEDDAMPTSKKTAPPKTPVWKRRGVIIAGSPIVAALIGFFGAAFFRGSSPAGEIKQETNSHMTATQQVVVTTASPGPSRSVIPDADAHDGQDQLSRRANSTGYTLRHPRAATPKAAEPGPRQSEGAGQGRCSGNVTSTNQSGGITAACVENRYGPSS